MIEVTRGRTLPGAEEAVRKEEAWRATLEAIERWRRLTCERVLESTKRILREIADEAKWLVDHEVVPDRPWEGIEHLVHEGKKDEAAEAIRHVIRLKSRQRALVRTLESLSRVCGEDKWFTLA